ncbi:hypothetical protein SEA_LEWANDO_2 [Arthrobacter phage Lewando]|nr:hypothetical protein SEA_LEWANDO_2 [Arthrobacter phage Lewando]
MAAPRRTRKVYDSEIVEEEKAVVRRRRPPATTPEARENELIAASYDLAEKQIAEGTASAQIITHFLRMGTQRERLERSKIEQENLVLKAKVEAMASSARVEEMYGKALSAMRAYSGQTVEDEDED